jgi:hypothetical protein
MLEGWQTALGMMRKTTGWMGGDLYLWRCKRTNGLILFNNLYGEEVNMIYRCWNTAAKLAWDVPRSTFTFLVYRVLTGDMTSVRDAILTRYAMFLQSIRTTARRSGYWPAFPMLMGDASLEVM